MSRFKYWQKKKGFNYCIHWALRKTNIFNYKFKRAHARMNRKRIVWYLSIDKQADNLTYTVRSLLNAIKGCIRKLLRKPFLKLILVAKFLYVYDILILRFENNQKNIFRKNWGMWKKCPIFKYKWKYKGKSH